MDRRSFLKFLAASLVLPLKPAKAADTLKLEYCAKDGVRLAIWHIERPLAESVVALYDGKGKLLASYTMPRSISAPWVKTNEV